MADYGLIAKLGKNWRGSHYYITWDGQTTHKVSGLPTRADVRKVLKINHPDVQIVTAKVFDQTVRATING